MVGVIPLNKIVILEVLQFSGDGDFSIIEGEFEALVIYGWNVLSGVDPWVTKENIVWEIKV